MKTGWSHCEKVPKVYRTIRKKTTKKNYNNGKMRDREDHSAKNLTL